MRWHLTFGACNSGNEEDWEEQRLIWIPVSNKWEAGQPYLDQFRCEHFFRFVQQLFQVHTEQFKDHVYARIGHNNIEQWHYGRMCEIF